LSNLILYPIPETDSGEYITPFKDYQYYKKTLSLQNKIPGSGRSINQLPAKK